MPTVRSSVTAEPAAAAPVLIVGLGPVGATLAVLLGQAGVPTVVLERDRAPHALPRAAHLDGDALRVLAAAGVAREVVDQSRPIDGFRLVDARLRPLVHARKRVAVETGWPEAVLIHQPAVERALRERLGELPDVEVRTRHAVEAIEEDTGGVTVCGVGPDGPFAVRAAFVVGCDGARSVVREAMGARLVGSRPGGAGQAFEQPWLVVDTLLRREVALPEGLLQIADPRRPATFVPFPGRRRRWEFRLRPGETEAQMTRPDAIRARLAAYVDPGAVEVERAAVYTFHDLVAQPWRRGRLVVIGDAAHQMPPFLGQGIGAGVQDAATLAWMLALVWHGKADARLLDALEAERRPHVEAVTRLAVRLGRLISAGGASAWLRDAVLHAAARVGPLRRRLLDLSAPFPAVRPVLGDPPRRARVPNPRLTTSDRIRFPFDDVAGARFDGPRLAGAGFAIVGLGVDARAWAGGQDVWTRLGARFVTVDGPAVDSLEDRDGLLGVWAGRVPAVVVVRPDRLALGIYGPADGDRAAADVRRALRLV